MFNWQPHLPNRVSRLYPFFAIGLALSSSAFFYEWQRTELELSSLSSQIEQHDKGLQQQINSLTTAQILSKAVVESQKQKISDTASKLQAIQTQLDSQTKALASKESELKQSQDQLNLQKDQLSQNASELSQLRSRPPLFNFSANQSNISDLSAKQAAVKDLVNTAYPYIQKLYGEPYLLSSISITFVDHFTISGATGEIVIQNSSSGISIDIHLLDFDQTSFADSNALIHEIIHGFHGVAVLQTSALEEGMTVAATDAVMQRMIDDGKLPHFSHLYLTIDDQTYTQLNQILRVSADNTAFYRSPQIGLIYQLIGTAWYRLYQADPNIFSQVNNTYYPKVQHGLLPDTALILDAIRANIATVHGQATNDYLSSNRAFNPN